MKTQAAFSRKNGAVALSLILAVTCITACDTGGGGSSKDTSLSAPKNGAATGSGPTTMYLTWGNVSGATGYNVYRSETETGEYALVGDAELASYHDSILTAQTDYWYQVSATDGDREGPACKPFMGTTLAVGAASLVPDAPEILIMTTSMRTASRWSGTPWQASMDTSCTGPEGPADM